MFKQLYINNALALQMNLLAELSFSLYRIEEYMEYDLVWRVLMVFVFP